MPDRLGPFIADPVAFAKREAIRRRQRAHGIYLVPPPAVLDRIVAEHAAAARLGRHGHDEACETWAEGYDAFSPCYCSERREAIERVEAKARRAGLDSATGKPLESPLSVTSEQQLEEEAKP